MNLTTVVQHLRIECSARGVAVARLRSDLTLRMVGSTDGRYKLEMERERVQPSDIEVRTVRQAVEALGWQVTAQSTEIERVGMIQRRWMEIDIR